VDWCPATLGTADEVDRQSPGSVAATAIARRLGFFGGPSVRAIGVAFKDVRGVVNARRAVNQTEGRVAVRSIGPGVVPR
jgi:hypothetical protein